MMMIKILKNLNALSFLLLALIAHRGNTQDMRIADSLIFKLHHEPIEDSLKFELLNDIAFYHTEPSIGLEYASEALALSRKLGPLFEARALGEISLYYRELGNMVQCIATSLESLNIYEKLGIPKSIASLNLTVGSNYLADHNYPLAKSYLFEAIELLDSLKYENTLSRAYINLGETYRLDQNQDSAKYYSIKALEIAKRNNSPVVIGYALGNLGMINARDTVNQAKDQLNEAITILKENGDMYSVSVYMFELGKLALAEKDYPVAEKQLLAAFSIVMQYGLKEQIKDFSIELANLYEEKGEFSKALQYQRTYQIYQDSLVNVDNIRAIAQIEKSHEIEKKETEIKYLTDREEIVRYRTYALIACLILFIGLIAMLIIGLSKRKKANTLLVLQKSKIEKQAKEKDIFLNELNHRTKNNLQIISSILSLQSKELVDHPSYDMINEGKSRVDALSFIHQALYLDSYDMKINIKRYLDTLVDKLVLSYNIGVEKEIETDEFDIHVDKAVPLALIVNELVTNALKYAYITTDHPKLNIKLIKDNSLVKMDVKDNGVGLSDQDWQKSDSFGFKLVKALISQLSGVIRQVSESGGCHWKIEFDLNAYG